LLAKEGKTARERLTLIRVFEELRGLGYDGGYDAVRRYAKVWRAVGRDGASLCIGGKIARQTERRRMYPWRAASNRAFDRSCRTAPTTAERDVSGGR
jgi:hypothetical protein